MTHAIATSDSAVNPDAAADVCGAPATLLAPQLAVATGQYSTAGRKAENRDVLGICAPEGPVKNYKGVTLAMADGISTGAFGRIAAEVAVGALLNDYYATPESWSTGRAVSQVVAASNAWLYMQTRNGSITDTDLGHVCTLSALVLKGREAHVFNVGDSRIYRIIDGGLEPLTEDHCVAGPCGRLYLSRALGVDHTVEIDYRRLPLDEGDLFLLATDGVHEHLNRDTVRWVYEARDLDTAARAIAEAAWQAGADDNLSVQLARIETLPGPDHALCREEARRLSIVPPLANGDELDGFRIIRPLHEGARSAVYLARAPDEALVALKCPAVELLEQLGLRERFAFEEWILRRVASTHVVRAATRHCARSALYVATEYVAGKTLRQWMIDCPEAGLDTVRDFAGQLVKGLRALHRREMIHQDLRPENVLVGDEGTLRIIDLGSAAVAGIEEVAPGTLDALAGTWQYTAPEYFTGDIVSWRSDQFSLGVILYEMLTGRLPYGARAGRVRSRRDQQRLSYQPASTDDRPLPFWIDGALRRATHPDPARRYAALSEFLRDLHRPPAGRQSGRHMPLAERNPVRFWQGVSLLLALAALLLALQLGRTL